MIYEADEDVLEVTFDVVDENFSRSIPLNEEIVLHTDANVSSAWGITFYNYAKLLQVTETHLDELSSLDAAHQDRIFSIIAKSPISKFLELLDTESLRAIVKSPRVLELIQAH